MNQIDLGPFLSDPTSLPRSTTLLRENGLRTLLLHLKSGEQIPEHQARGAITVQCLQGKVSFSAAEKTAELSPDLLISLPPGCPHSLVARKDSLLLVTISEPAV